MSGEHETCEQQARDMLERLGVERAQKYTASDLVEFGNLIADARRGDARIAELEAKARTDANNIAELQQIVESYNAFCKGAGAHVVLAEQDAEIKRLRAEVGRLRGAWKLAPAAEVGDDRKDEVAEYIDHEITKYRNFNNPSMMQLYDDALAMLNELDDYREAAIAASKEGKR